MFKEVISNTETDKPQASEHKKKIYGMNQIKGWHFKNQVNWIIIGLLKYLKHKTQ